MYKKSDFPIPDPIPDTGTCIVCGKWTYRYCKKCGAPVCSLHNYCPNCRGTEFYTQK